MENLLYPEHSEYITDIESYNRGMERIMLCHHQINNMEGGSPSLKNVATYLGDMFSEESRYNLSIVIRSIIRTGIGAAADVATVGAGGDIAVNAVFAMQTTSKFIKNVHVTIKELMGGYELFNKIFFIDMGKKIPIVAKYNLDKGFGDFQKYIEKSLTEYLEKSGSRSMDKIMDSIEKTIDKIITAVSDWIACMFPDTAGLAGEISKKMLVYISENTYNIIYKLVGLFPDENKRMITDIHALQEFIEGAMAFLRDFMRGLKSSEMTKIIQAIGSSVNKAAENSSKAGVINVGTGAVTSVANLAVQAYSLNARLAKKFSIMPQMQDIIAGIIDKLIIPNIGSGVALFDQLFPIFLAFAVFKERYRDLSAAIKGK